MVCMLGCGSMATMARLLKVGSFQGITPEEMSNEKIAAQAIHHEFEDADEANLLEEEDMHVFDHRPLTDTLYLVRCNPCKKPIKASQYSAHAVHCGNLNTIHDVSDINGGISSLMKFPKKGKKVIQRTNGNFHMAAVKQEKSALLDGNCNGDSASNSVPVAPAPVATKIYYSQGSNYLRSELKHLFHEVWTKEHSGDPPNS